MADSARSTTTAPSTSSHSTSSKVHTRLLPLLPTSESLCSAAADADTISSGKYPVSRPLFVYAKKAHIGVVPGMKEFMAEYVSDRAMASGGYLEKKGLVSMPKAEIEKVRSQVTGLTNLAM